MNITVQQSLSRWFKNHFESDKEKELDFTQVVNNWKHLLRLCMKQYRKAENFIITGYV